MTLAAQYSNRELVPDHPQIIASWHSDAQDFRARAKADIDLSYGAGPRNRFDLFHPRADKDGPLVVFIHGGYWRSFDKSVFSHMAAGATAHGLTVAVPSYSLCHAVQVHDIIDELRQFCLEAGRLTGRRLLVCGHSAGGHLAACMAATDWSLLGAPPDLIQAGLSISGLFDLRPLLATPLNDDIRLTASSALAASPLSWPVPQSLSFHSWVGALESREFIRQSETLSAAWTGLGLDAPHVEVAGKNHFTVPDGLADPKSAMTRQIVALAGL